MSTAATVAPCIDPEHTTHAHCPEHGCVEYLCCMPTAVKSNARWNAEQFDAFTDMVLAGVGTVDEVASHLILFGADETNMRGLADAARPYV